MQKSLFFLMLVSSTLFMGVEAHADDNWKVEIIPYAWLAGIDGTVAVVSQEVNINTGLGDLFSDGNVGGSFLAEAERNNWTLQTQFDFISLDSDKIENLGSNAALDNDSIFGLVAFGYQLPLLSDESTLGILGGIRFLNMHNELIINGDAMTDRTLNYEDGIIMLQPKLQLSDWLAFNASFSIGAGDSTLFYEMQPQLRMQFSDEIVGLLGYRRMTYDVGDEFRGLDGDIHGFLVGVGISF